MLIGEGYKVMQESRISTTKEMKGNLEKWREKRGLNGTCDVGRV